MATPIGNLEDITLRALRVLREVPLIAAEDTRHSGRLLKHFDIQTRLISFHEHSNANHRDAIIDALSEGDVALISDAGTPGVSDPGFDLVTAAIAAGHQVSPIPGPSAAIAAVPASGLAPDGFLFVGFLPRRSRDRREVLIRVKDLRYPLVIYEAPHRLSACLTDLGEVLGDRPVAMAREMTKLHEELIHTTLLEARERYERERPRGEFVLVIGLGESGTEEHVTIESDDVLRLLHSQLESGESPSTAAKAVAKQTGLPRSQVYERLHEIERKPMDVEGH
ncbi:MAG: 16S rRNA (cytidine(1402)-2'-O)-methyltransferase [Nitrolancea sp.]